MTPNAKRLRKYSESSLAKGLCRRCHKNPLVPSSTRCERCLVYAREDSLKRREDSLKRSGTNRWAPGSAGQIPKTATESEIVAHVLRRLYK